MHNVGWGDKAKRIQHEGGSEAGTDEGDHGNDILCSLDDGRDRASPPADG